MASIPETNQTDMSDPVSYLGSGSTSLPIAFQNALDKLYDYLYERDTKMLAHLFSVQFPQCIDIHYSKSRMPPTSVVSDFYKAKGKFHAVVMAMYHELYYRHLFANAKEQSCWDDRVLSWNNYCMLFDFLCANVVMVPQADSSVVLPDVWLWNIFDEFVFQFQDAHRTKWVIIEAAKLTEMPNIPNDWDPVMAQTMLQVFVTETNISEIMNDPIRSKDICEGNLAHVPLKIKMGYFASVSLMKLNCLFCDYHFALKAVDQPKPSPFFEVPLCSAAVHYACAFAHLMAKNFVAAVSTASQYLLTSGKTPYSVLSNTSIREREQLDRFSERFYLIVLSCMFLCPGIKVEESIQNYIKEHHSSRFYKLQTDDEDAFAEVFRRFAPHFASPMVCRADLSPEVVRQQISEEIANEQLFTLVADLPRRKKGAQLVSFARLYNNISLERLASLMDYSNLSDADATIATRSAVMALAMKPNGSDISFEIENNVLHVKTQKSTKSYTDAYVRLITNIKDVARAVENMPSRSGATA